jgi:hypothetical protein
MELNEKDSTEELVYPSSSSPKWNTLTFSCLICSIYVTSTLNSWLKFKKNQTEWGVSAWCILKFCVHSLFIKRTLLGGMSHG